MANVAILVAPNIETIRETTVDATNVNEQEKFDEIKTAIEEAAAAGSFEVVFREDMTEEDKKIYPEILKNSGYGVCIGKYNGTNKICTLVFWSEKDENDNVKWIEEKDAGVPETDISKVPSDKISIKKNPNYKEA